MSYAIILFNFRNSTWSKRCSELYFSSSICWNWWNFWRYCH